MKKANKWVLTAAAVLAVTLSYQVIANVMIKGIKAGTETFITLQVNNKSNDYKLFQTGGVTTVNWPTSIPKQSSKNAQIALPNNTSSNVVYGVNRGYGEESDCNFIFTNIGGTISVTASPIQAFGAFCDVAKGAAPQSVIIQVQVGS